jgi:type II secretory pathway component GspD/PulD (secretin)
MPLNRLILKKTYPLAMVILVGMSGMCFGGLLPKAKAYAHIQELGGGRYTINASQEPIQALASQLGHISGMNLILDDSLTGSTTLKLQNVTALEALKTMCRMYGLVLQEGQAGIWMLTSQNTLAAQGVTSRNVEVVVLQNTSAAWMASLLNQALFSQQQGGGSGDTSSPTHLPVKPNERTNSIILTGSKEDIAFAKQMAKTLDVARERRVYQLSYARSVEVAEQVEASIFGDRGNAQLPGVSGQASVSVERYTVEDGSMTNELSNDASGASATQGGGSDTSSTAPSAGGAAQVTGMRNEANVTIRSHKAETGSYLVQTVGAVVIPNTRMNTLTVVGTPYQLQQVEELLPTLDAKPAQVSIQADLIEVSSLSLKELGFSVAFTESGSPWSFNLGALLPGTVNSIGFLENASFTDALNVQIRALLQNGKAKSIASPHVVATHDSEAVINITDQILRGQQFSAAGNSQFFGQTTPLIGQAGITLDILPKVGANNNVTLRVHPVVTSVYSSAGTGASTIELLRSRDLAAQSVSLRDGESMVIGGLIDSRESNNEQKIPVLGDLPIVGAMFRASRTSKSKSELIVLITPRILNRMEPTPIHRIDAGAGLGSMPYTTGQRGN